MIDKSIYEGVMEFTEENTLYVIDYIKQHKELLGKCIEAGKKGIEEACFEYARKHNDEFGDRFILELYDVSWRRVWSAIK